MGKIVGYYPTQWTTRHNMPGRKGERAKGERARGERARGKGDGGIQKLPHSTGERGMNLEVWQCDTI